MISADPIVSYALLTSQIDTLFNILYLDMDKIVTSTSLISFLLKPVFTKGGDEY